MLTAAVLHRFDWTHKAISEDHGHNLKSFSPDTFLLGNLINIQTLQTTIAHLKECFKARAYVAH